MRCKQWRGGVALRDVGCVRVRVEGRLMVDVWQHGTRISWLSEQSAHREERWEIVVMNNGPWIRIGRVSMAIDAP